MPAIDFTEEDQAENQFDFQPDEAPAPKIQLSPYEQADLAAGGHAVTPEGMTGDFTAALATQLPRDISAGLEKAWAPIESAGANFLNQLKVANAPETALTTGQAPDTAPYAQAGVPLLDLPLAAPGEKGVIPSLSRFAAGLTTPGNLITLPFAEALKPVQAYFAAQAAASVPQSIQALDQARTTDETTGAVTDLGANLLMGGLMGRGLLKGKSAPVEPPISADHEALLKQEGASMDVPIRLAGDAPRPGQFMGVNRETGGIEVYPENFSRWLNRVPEAQRPAAVASRLGEERIHLSTTDEDAGSYWGTLSLPEQLAFKRIYAGNFKGEAGGVQLSDTALGHEALRYRIQQLSRMTPSEVAEAAGREKWTVKSLQALADLVRTIREKLGTKASGTALAILDRVQENLADGKVAEAVGGKVTVPAALDKAENATLEDVDKMSGADFFKASTDWKNDAMAGKGLTVQQQAEKAALAKPDVADWEKALADQSAKRGRLMDELKAGGPEMLMQRQSELMGEAQKAQFFAEGLKVLRGQQEAPAATIKPQMDLNLPDKPELGDRPSASELGAKPFTSYELAKAGADHLQAGSDRALEQFDSGQKVTPPSFEDYQAAMRSKYGDLKPGQLFEGYQNALYTRMFNASGRVLEALAKSVGVKSERIADPTTRRSGLALEQEADNPAAAAQQRAETLGAAQRERYRNLVIGRIAEKLLDEAAPEAKSGTRTKVSPEDLGDSRTQTKQPVFFDVSSDDLKSPAVLAQRLVQDARRSNRDPVSLTKRLTALMDKQTGKTYLVSTYPHGRSGAMLVDPSVSSIRAHRPLSQILTRFRPVASLLLDEPVQNFRQAFDSLGDFEAKMGTDARRASQQTFEEPLREGEAPEPGSWEKGAPITDAEAGSILDHITSEVGRFDSVDDVKASLDALKEDGNPQVLSAYRKLAERLMQQNPDLSDEGLINQLAQNIYDTHKAAPDYETFVKRTMAQGGAAYREAVETRPDAGGSETAKELTMPIARRPPTDVRPENIPPEEAAKMAAAKRPPPPMTEGSPAAFDKLNDADLRKRGEEDLPEYEQEFQRAWSRPEVLTTGEDFLDAAHDPEVLKLYREGYSDAPTTAYELSSEGAGHVGGGGLSYADRFVNRLSKVGFDRSVGTPPERVKWANYVRKNHPELWHQTRLESLNGNWPSGAQKAFALEKLKDIGQTDFGDLVLEDWKNHREDVWTQDPGLAAWIEKHYYGKDFGPIAEETGPAAFDKAVKDELERVGDTVKGLVSKSEMTGNLAKSLDEAGNKTNIQGREAEESIRIAASKKPSGMASAVIRNWRRGDQQTLHAANALVEAQFDRSKLASFLNQLQAARVNAENLQKTGNWRDRRLARAWLRDIDASEKEVTYAQNHWSDPELQATARKTKQSLDSLYDLLKSKGFDINKIEGFIPHRLLDVWAGAGSLYQLPEVMGTNYRAPRVFKTHYEALEAGPYMRVTHDVASLVGHAWRKGLADIYGDEWKEGLKAITMPDGSPMGADPKIVKNQPLPPSHNYEVVNTGHGWIAVHKDVSGAVKNLTDTSYFDNSPIAGVALHLEQTLKHGMLLGDFFHFFKTLYFAGSNIGTRALGLGKSGWHVLDLAEKDVPEAVRKGIISQKDADWGNQKVNGITRRQIVELAYQHSGANLGRVSDALYKDLMSEMTPTSGILRRGLATVADPTAGRWNRFLFDKMTRGLMAESIVSEFERQSKANPSASPDALMRDISRDINERFGNLGRQGVFKSKTAQDWARLVGLAPQWVEGLARTEARAYGRLSGASTLLGQRKGVTALGATGQSVGKAMAFMFGLTQAINLITRGQPTWKNEEDGHKMDAWIPGWGSNKEGFWFNPLSIFMELSHDLYRLGAAQIQKDKPISDVLFDILANKESPIARALAVMGTGKNLHGEKITSSVGRLVTEPAKAMVPLPITFGKYAQMAGHAVAPGTVPPVPISQIQRQTAGTFGVKIEPAQSGPAKMHQLAEKFMKSEGLKKESGWEQIQTDEPNYTKLRQAIRDKDYSRAKSVYQSLLKGRTPQQVNRYMKQASKAPFTGSSSAEKDFVRSLDSKQLDRYSAAQEKMQDDYERFSDWVNTQP